MSWVRKSARPVQKDRGMVRVVRRVPGLTLKRQVVLGWKSPSQAWQVMGASAKVEAATRMERPQEQAAAIRLVLRRVPGPVVASLRRHKVMASARAVSWVS